jgi:hypothetical protein
MSVRSDTRSRRPGPEMIIATICAWAIAVLLIITVLSPSTTPEAAAADLPARATPLTRTTSTVATPQSTPSTPQNTATTKPSPSAAAASPTSSTLDPAQAAKDAEAAMRSYLELADETYRRADGEVETALASVAVGAALGEVEAGAIELESSESRQSGSVRVSDVTVEDVDVTGDPPTVVLTACLDSADVDILDVNGDSMRLGRPGIVTRTAHIYRIEFRDDTWRVARHDFPDEAGC